MHDPNTWGILTEAKKEKGLLRHLQAELKQYHKKKDLEFQYYGQLGWYLNGWTILQAHKDKKMQ